MREIQLAIHPIVGWMDYVIVKSHYEEVIVVITRVRGGAEDECNNNDNLRVQWDLTGFYPIVFDVRHVTQLVIAD